jgi:hypothetical protein
VDEPSSFGRSLVVAYAPNFLVNQPNLREEVISILQRRMNDRETTIRFGVVKAINRTTKRDLGILHHTNLLDILKHSFYDNNVSNLCTNSATLRLNCFAFREYIFCFIQLNLVIKNQNFLMSVITGLCLVNV